MTRKVAAAGRNPARRQGIFAEYVRVYKPGEDTLTLRNFRFSQRLISFIGGCAGEGKIPKRKGEISLFSREREETPGRVLKRQAARKRILPNRKPSEISFIIIITDFCRQTVRTDGKI